VVCVRACTCVYVRASVCVRASHICSSVGTCVKSIWSTNAPGICKCTSPGILTRPRAASSDFQLRLCVHLCVIMFVFVSVSARVRARAATGTERTCTRYRTEGRRIAKIHKWEREERASDSTQCRYPAGWMTTTGIFESSARRYRHTLTQKGKKKRTQCKLYADRCLVRAGEHTCRH